MSEDLWSDSEDEEHGNMETKTIVEVMITDNIVRNKHDYKTKAHDGTRKEIIGVQTDFICL